MKLEIVLSDMVVQDAVRKCWANLFQSPASYGSGGDGYAMLRNEILKHLAEPAVVAAMRTEIRAVAARLAPGIVRGAVSEELRKMAVKAVKDERKQGTLFAGGGEPRE